MQWLLLSLVSLSTNETPHERLFRFPWRSTYSVVRLRDGRESTVPTSDLTPYPPVHNGNADPANIDSLPESNGVCGNDVEDVAADETDGVRFEKETENDESSVPEHIASDSEPALPRRSTRRRKSPDRYGFSVASIWTGEIVEIRVLVPRRLHVFIA